MSDMLLDLLRARVGETIRKVSPRKGGEYHSPCPSCGGNDRFICFPEQPGGDVAQRHGLTGTWSCPRHCQTGGDIISFLTTFEGLSFGDACKQLGIDSSQEFRRYRPLRQPGRQPGGSNGFTPRAYAAPADQWVAQATKLATKAHARLLVNLSVLAWLERRGLPLEAVQAYGLGYIEGEGGDGTCIFRSRESFGLHTILKENGKPKKPPAAPVVRDGEIWVLGRHRLMCGDSTSSSDMRRLMGETLADMVWTDPPYNVDYSGKAGKVKNDKMSAVDFSAFLLAAHRVMFESVRQGGGVYVAHSEAGESARQQAYPLSGAG